MEELNYTDSGHGKVIVLLHGFCESLEIWNYFSDELSKYCRVICVDLPGFGNSTYHGEEISIELLSERIHTLIIGLGITKYGVIGHSLGGYISLALAEMYPSHLQSMVLFHSTAFEDSQEKKESRDKIISFIERNGLSTFMDSFVTPLFAETNRIKCKADIHTLIRIGKKANQDAVIATLIAMKKRKERIFILKDCLVPTLLIIGEKDIAVPISDSLEMTELNDTIQSIVLKDCAHMGIYEKPQTCLAKIKEFHFS